LLPAFDAWRTGDTTKAATPAVAVVGTLDWVFAEYRSDRRYTRLDPKSRRNHETGFKLVGNYSLKDGTRLGARRVSLIDTNVTDALYEKLLVLRDDDGNMLIPDGYEPNPTRPIKSQSGPIKNQSGGLDSGISIELFQPLAASILLLEKR
jgi:hypothetical protein